MRTATELLIRDGEFDRIIVAEHGMAGKSGELRPFRPTIASAHQETERAKPLKESQLTPPPPPSPQPPRQSRFKRLLNKSGEWFQDQVNNLDPRPTYKKALGSIAIKAERVNQNVHEKTRQFFRKPKRAIGAIALVGVLAGGIGMVSAIEKSTPERAPAATEMTDLGQETAAVDVITDRDRLESWVEDHPDADVGEAFESLASASDYELQMVYNQEVQNAIDGVYGPYNGEFPDWLQ